MRGYAQSHTFTRVVIILQENRTPDNIFGSTPTFLPGVDVVGNGYIATCAAQTPRQVPMMQNSDGLSGCSNGYHPPQDPQYQYLPSDVAQPYFAIATNYGLLITCSRRIRVQVSQRTSSLFMGLQPQPPRDKIMRTTSHRRIRSRATRSPGVQPHPASTFSISIPWGMRTSTLTTGFPATSTRRLPVSYRISLGESELEVTMHRLPGHFGRLRTRSRVYATRMAGRADHATDRRGRPARAWFSKVAQMG